MGVSHELMMASTISEDPTKLLMAVPATIMGVGAAAKSFTIVHQSEMGVRTRRGAPMLKRHILNSILQEINTEVPDLRAEHWVPDGAPAEMPDLSVLPDLRDLKSQEEFLASPELPLLPVHNYSKKDLRKKSELNMRIKEKIEELPPEIRKEGVYQIVGQGIVWLVPFIDSVVKINVASQTTALEDFPLDCLKGPSVNIVPAITWNVRSDGDNPYKALFDINNEKETKIKNKTQELEQTIGWICSDGLTKILRDRKYDEIRNSDSKEITAEVQRICGDDLSRFGVNLENIWMKFPSYTPSERLAQALEGRPDSDKAAMVTAAALTSDGGAKLKLSLVPDESA